MLVSNARHGGSNLAAGYKMCTPLITAITAYSSGGQVVYPYYFVLADVLYGCESQRVTAIGAFYKPGVPCCICPSLRLRT